MTREEAIKRLENIDIRDALQEDYDALHIAIKALEHPERNVVAVVPCGDTISRQAVLDIINFEDKWLLDAKGHNANTEIAFSGMKSKVSALPSVNPQEPKTGHWIKHDNGAWWECSECHAERAYGNEYCPDCGSHNGDIAKMVEPQESEG